MTDVITDTNAMAEEEGGGEEVDQQHKPYRAHCFNPACNYAPLFVAIGEDGRKKFTNEFRKHYRVKCDMTLFRAALANGALYQPPAGQGKVYYTSVQLAEMNKPHVTDAAEGDWHGDEIAIGNDDADDDRHLRHCRTHTDDTDARDAIEEQDDANNDGDIGSRDSPPDHQRHRRQQHPHHESRRQHLSQPRRVLKPTTPVSSLDALARASTLSTTAVRSQVAQLALRRQNQMDAAVADIAERLQGFEDKLAHLEDKLCDTMKLIDEQRRAVQDDMAVLNRKQRDTEAVAERTVERLKDDIARLDVKQKNTDSVVERLREGVMHLDVKVTKMWKQCDIFNQWILVLRGGLADTTGRVTALLTSKAADSTTH